MRVIVIVGRTREEKEETEENRLAVTAANMPLLDSNAGFPLLRLRLHTISETIIQLSKEKNVCPTKEEASVTLVFVMSSSLVLSMLSSRSIIRAAADHLDIYIYIYMRVCLLLALSTYIHICLLVESLLGWVDG
jgi:hypothetical protein